jgi:hypothetical protein
MSLHPEAKVKGDQRERLSLTERRERLSLTEREGGRQEGQVDQHSGALW